MTEPKIGLSQQLTGLIVLIVFSSLLNNFNVYLMYFAHDTTDVISLFNAIHFIPYFIIEQDRRWKAEQPSATLDP